MEGVGSRTMAHNYYGKTAKPFHLIRNESNGMNRSDRGQRSLSRKTVNRTTRARVNRGRRGSHEHRKNPFPPEPGIFVNSQLCFHLLCFAIVKLHRAWPREKKTKGGRPFYRILAVLKTRLSLSTMTPPHIIL